MSPAYSMVFKNERLRTPALILITLGFTYASVMPYQSVIAIHEFGLTNDAYSLLIFAASIVNVVASVFFGAISDRSVDRRMLVMRLCFVGAMGFGIVYLVPSPVVFIICTITLIPMCNCANPLLFASVRAEVGSLDKATSASVTSIVRAGFAAAFAAAPGVVGFVLSTTNSMMPAYAIACVASTVSLLLYLMARSPTHKPVVISGSHGSLFGSVARIFQRDVIAAVVAVSALNALIRINNIVTPLIITGFPNASMADVGLNSGLVALIEMPFMILWGSLQRYMRAAYVLALGAGAYSAYLVLLSRVSEPYQIYALLLLNACGAAAILSVSITYLQDLISERPGLGSSLISLTTCISAGMAAAVFAMGASIVSYSTIALMAAVLGIVAIGALLLLEMIKPTS